VRHPFLELRADVERNVFGGRPAAAERESPHHAQRFAIDVGSRISRDSAVSSSASATVA
jgi:hypothetical protein